MTNNVNASELHCFADNDGATYRQLVSCYQNLQRKMAKGKYDRELAVKLFTYAAESAAKAYHREFIGHGKWHEMFSVADRVEAAKLMRDSFESEIEAGNSWLN